jgi:hypothetical protein
MAMECMRTDQFMELLGRLELGRASQRTAKAFGLSVRQLQQITGGRAPVPRPVALLAIAYTKFGLPNPLWNPDAPPRNAAQRLVSRRSAPQRIVTN